MDTGKLINKISIRLRRRSEKMGKNLGITEVQGRILDFILVDGRDRPLYQKDIEKALSLKNPTVTGILKRLDEKGFILAVPSNQDKRCKNIYPTEKAYDSQKKMDNYRKKIDRRLTIGMSKKEFAALEKMLDRVLYNISDP